jgi:hypothetical protein
MPSAFVLVIVILTVESSYLRNTEKPVGGTSDTVQFYFTPDRDWRIKTYATDHDIHVHVIRESDQERVFAAADAEANSKKHYGDVIDRVLVLEFSDPANKAATAQILAAHNLPGQLQIGNSGVAFYNPDGGRYHSQSVPQ